MPGPTGGSGEWNSDAALEWNSDAASGWGSGAALDGIAESGCQNRSADSIINNV